ncbi:MAG: c-type cytochrome [Bryobacterales bacterium]|nr:c-type cytochrome [Bryobacterales bacterium]
MKLAALFTLAACSLAAQDIYQRGAEVFKKSCAQGYCHGTAGAQGRAPELTGQNFNQAAVAKIIYDGVPNTGMPGFKNQLAAGPLEAVIAYVVKISGGNYVPGASSATFTPAAAMPADAARGKALFFDAVRGVHRCGTCHSLEGMGTAVGPNLATVSAPDSVTVAAIRKGRGVGIRLATVAGEAPFPVLVMEQTAGSFRLFDLSANPPVLRTIPKGEVTLSGGAVWLHSDSVRNYTDQELAPISAYLRWLAAQ